MVVIAVACRRTLSDREMVVIAVTCGCSLSDREVVVIAAAATAVDGMVALVLA